jgi:hypothetical protein
MPQLEQICNSVTWILSAVWLKLPARALMMTSTATGLAPSKFAIWVGRVAWHGLLLQKRSAAGPLPGPNAPQSLQVGACVN